ncbi:MAG: 50S ribosomal protein L13 [Nitrospiraceae bacterium]|nr:50S ribosomal protein L13 [Nitrospiraceae bacterium]
MRTRPAQPEHMIPVWHVIDAQGKVLGRLASRVAGILRGKHKPTFTPHLDLGDHVIIVNAEKIHLTGSKLKKKVYHHHTGFPGGLKSITAEQLLEKKPTDLLCKAIYGMLPKNKLRKQLAAKLRVYAGPEHPHSAQKPQPLTV